MRKLTMAVLAFALVGSACSGGGAVDTLQVGAIYPLSGSQGPGGIDEHRGVLLAADLANLDGGVDGREIEVRSIDVPGSDAAASAIDQLNGAGIDLVLGSYGSTISAPASTAAASNGMLFWETGAVGTIPPESDPGGLTFRVPPAGAVLGRAAIAFVADQVVPEHDLHPAAVRYAISYVDDVYGRTVASGARAELAERGLRNVGEFGYDFRTVDMPALVRQIAAAKPDVLFVSAYLYDAIDLRRELVAQHVKLLANIGTSSSYCMPEFGATLGEDAVGVYASDKPSADSIDPSGLSPAGRALLRRANDAYHARWDEDMSPAALAGFSAAWSFFTSVLPAAVSMDPTDVAAAARTIDLPRGSLPNGSGLRFGAAGAPNAGDNLAAASVIWEWVAPGRAAVIWPPAFATSPMDTSHMDAW